MMFGYGDVGSTRVIVGKAIVVKMTAGVAAGVLGGRSRK
jgi:hypothetical protein